MAGFQYDDEAVKASFQLRRLLLDVMSYQNRITLLWQTAVTRVDTSEGPYGGEFVLFDQAAEDLGRNDGMTVIPAYDAYDDNCKKAHFQNPFIFNWLTDFVPAKNMWYLIDTLALLEEQILIWEVDETSNQYPVLYPGEIYGNPPNLLQYIREFVGYLKRVNLCASTNPILYGKLRDLADEIILEQESSRMMVA